MRDHVGFTHRHNEMTARTAFRTGQVICGLPGRLPFWEARRHDGRLRE